MVPKLRFREFDGAWREKKIDEIFSSIAGGGTPSKDDSYWTGTIPWISSSDVSEDSITGIDVTRFISESAIKNSATKLIPRDSVLVVSRVGVGKVAISKFELCTSQDFTNLIGCKGSPYFYAHLLSHYMKRKASSVQGTAIKGVPSAEIKGYSVFAPDLGEQEKIASFFTLLDKKIALAERKLKKTYEIRNALLEGMLTQTIRFVESPGKYFPNWESVTIAELSTDLAYGMNASATEFDGKHRYIRITDIDDATREYLSENAVSPNKIPEIKYKLEVGDIVFARTGNSVGKSYLYKANDGDLYYAGFLIRARIKKDINPYFVYLNTLTKNFARWVSVSSQRSGQPGINSEQYGSYKLKLPCKVEQDKISDFMQNFEFKISNIKKRVSALRQMKKALLLQMFV